MNYINNKLHYPVLIKEVLKLLSPKKNDIIIDGTFGAGGYSYNILKSTECKIYAIDCDPYVQKIANKLKLKYSNRFKFLIGKFGNIKKILEAEKIKKVDGIIIDIGVSSMQIEQPKRGFSFQYNGPLDMRMNISGISAADVVNNLSKIDLANIFYILGNEKRSYSVADAIVKTRINKPLRTTFDLVNLIKNISYKHNNKIHPATKIFQALRIFVNQELNELVKLLNAAECILKPRGRLVVVSFHSLEDRIVKNFFKSRSNNLSLPSRHLMFIKKIKNPSFTLINRKVIIATKKELNINIRSRSAKLRSAFRNDNFVFKKYFNPLTKIPNLKTYFSCER